MKSAIHISRLILWSVFVAACWACDNESNTENPDLNYFVRYYGGNGNQYGADMLLLNDGSFVLLGTDAEDPFDTDLYLLRVDSEGEIVWELNYGQEDEIWTAKDLELTIDGNLIVLADYKADVSSSVDVRLLKFSLDGQFLISGAYGTAGPGNEVSRSVTPLADGGFVVSGMTDSTATIFLSGETDPDLGDAFDLRVDQNLVRFSKNEWDPYNGFGSNMDAAVKFFERPGDFFYVFGHTNSSLTGTLNPNERLGLFYFSRHHINNNVDQVWYPGNVVNSNDTEINQVREVPSLLGGGYLVIGTSRNNTGSSDIFMARMRSKLTFRDPLQNEASVYTTISFKTDPLGHSMQGVAGAPSVSGEPGFLILGNEVRDNLTTNLWLSKVDQAGGPIWSTTFGSEAEDDTGAAVIELPDGKIAILGTMGLADNQFKMALIKVNREGKLLK